MSANSRFELGRSRASRECPEALQAMAAAKDRALEESFPLLQSAGDGNGSGASGSVPATTSGASALDKLFGAGADATDD